MGSVEQPADPHHPPQRQVARPTPTTRSHHGHRLSAVDHPHDHRREHQHMSTPASHIIDAAHLATVPDGTIITWLRIPGDHTSEAVAFVRREVEYDGPNFRTTAHGGAHATVWISPGGWEPQTIESAGVSFPCRVVRWGELASQVVLGEEVATLAETLDSGGTWARQAALDAAVRVYQGQGYRQVKPTDDVLAMAQRFQRWLEADEL